MLSNLYASMRTGEPTRMIKSIKAHEMAVGIRIYGLIIAIIMIVVNSLRIPNVIMTTYQEISESMTLISFENRVTILPMGLESKNKIFALRTFSVIFLNIFFELTMIIRTPINARKKLKRK